MLMFVCGCLTVLGLMTGDVHALYGETEPVFDILPTPDRPSSSDQVTSFDAPTKALPTPSADLPSAAAHPVGAGQTTAEGRVMQLSGFWSDVVANLVGALVGAGLAIPTGLWLDRQVKMKEERERTRIVLRSVSEELAKNELALKDFLSKQPSEEVIAYPLLSSNAWQAAKGLGILSTSTDYVLRTTLVSVYERVDFITLVAQSLWSLFFYPSVDFGTLKRKTSILLDVLSDEAQKAVPLIQDAVEQTSSWLIK